MSLENLKGQRTRLKKRIEDVMADGKASLETDTSRDHLDEIREQLETRAAMLKELQHRYEVLSQRIVELMTDQTDEELEEEGSITMDMVLNMSEMMSKLLCRIKTVEGKMVAVVPVSVGSDAVQIQLQKLIELETIRQSHNTGRMSSVNLPKLDFDGFSGDVLKWNEFWDSFSASVHLNSGLQPVEKLAYLRAKLKCEAGAVIAGLETTNDNYEVALKLLKGRFGDAQTAITAHYTKIMDIPASPNHTEKLRSMFDSLEQHFRCLASLGEDTDHRHFISLIMTKLPKGVIIKLEEMKGSDEPWSVELLRSKLHCHLVAREAADRQSLGNSQTTCATSSSEFVRDSKLRMDGSSRGNGYQRQYRENFGRHDSKSGEQRATAEALMIDDRTRSISISKPHCVYCKEGHWSDECRKFATVGSRKRQLHGRCFNCFSQSHTLKNCQSNRTCWYCKRQRSHHRSLCANKFPVEHETAHVAAEEESSPIPSKSLLASGERALLQTPLAKAAIDGSKELTNVRVLFDSGSHRTYISQETIERLNLHPGKTESISINTFGAAKSKNIETKIDNFTLRLQDGSSIELVGNAVPQIAGSFERTPLNLSRYKDLLTNLRLADTLPTDYEQTTIDILIGSDYYLDFLTFERIPVGEGLHLLGSKLGWILSGRLPASKRPDSGVSMLILSMVNQSVAALSLFSEPDEIQKLPLSTEDYWNLETIGIKDDICGTSDDKALETFNDSVKFEDGRYQVAWPWRQEFTDLSSNYELALGRLKSLIRRLSSNEELLERYDKVIQDQVNKGIIEKIDFSDCATLTHYIPHHAVITPNKATTKIRIVYDASAKVRKDNKSLNECLLRGPVLLENLCGLLIRFRLHEVALVADIEKAFLQVGLQNRDRDVTRFLWLKDPSRPQVKDNLQVYRFCRVPFGVISSPFLLAATVSHHLRKRSTSVATIISENMYVDNMVTGVSSTTEACSFYREAKDIFKTASMNLREWNSNSKEFLEHVSEEDQTGELVVKVLGLLWNTKDDRLSTSNVEILHDNVRNTKRYFFKLVASVFDPLGLVCPILIRGKMLIQELWKEPYQWDDVLSSSFVSLWKEFSADLTKLSQISVPRFIGLPSAGKSFEYSLYCFCDASEKAYATVVYLNVDDGQYKNSTNVIFAKSRLAPMKRQTIPRLELMAVLIGVRSLKFVERQLRVAKVKMYLWTDSQCVLHWIASSRPLGVFVGNRLKEIRSHQDVSFYYVEGDQNPADIPSRGASVSDLNSSDLWWHGPPFLRLPESKWPCWKPRCEHHEANKSKGPSVLFEASIMVDDNFGSKGTPFSIDISLFSSLTRLIRVTAWCLRFVAKTRKKSDVVSEVLSVGELSQSKLLWEKNVQRRCFSRVFESVKDNTRSSIREQLDIHVTQDGLLRCGGRLKNANLSDEAKFPKLLPKGDAFTVLTIKDLHAKLSHAGVSHTLSRLRSEYWIPQGRRQVRTVLTNCLICRRWEGGPYKAPPMPAFPTSRVTQSAPFSFCGVDCFGPLYVKCNGQRSKVWLCLFTCLAVRAVHLELLFDLSSREFLLSLRRFVSRHGTPSAIYSDNATNFTAASKVVDAVWHNLTSDPEVQTYFSGAKVKWNFIVQLAPRMGGFYERLIGVVKRSLKKVLGKLCLSVSQLQTVLAEVGAVVNSRPLTYVGDDYWSGTSISPAHFLSLNPKIGCPEYDCSCDPAADADYVPQLSSHESLLDTWKKGNKHLDGFWKLWETEYILSLRERYQQRIRQPYSCSPSFPNVGDIVLVKEQLMPRGSWKVARVTELVPSADGLHRGAKLVFPSRAETTRPLALLYPLECSRSQISAIPTPSTSKDSQVSFERNAANVDASFSFPDKVHHSKKGNTTCTGFKVKVANDGHDTATTDVSSKAYHLSQRPTRRAAQKARKIIQGWMNEFDMEEE